ncbi:potassium channel regulatory protein isoform X2 [Caretta caretta]|uniref:potassium channel regulatory protein isoform X2 n=1 Tax=Caretta caretta TaxID=8467 RepID=UPI003D538634
MVLAVPVDLQFRNSLVRKTKVSVNLDRWRDNMSNQEVAILNVGGSKFTTWASTLRRFPESRLARMLNSNDHEFRLVNGQFFVDRDGTLFNYILDFLRTLQLSLPTDFSDYQRLQREADFYELHSLADLLSQENLLKPRPEILEVRFLLQETQAFFRVFGSCSNTIEKLLTPLPLERPSHHDLVFQCGTDYSAGDQLVARYVSIKPDHRKLINGTNVLGLLVDTLLREGFHLVSTRTVSAEEKVECYSFERMKRPETLFLTANQSPESPGGAQMKLTPMHTQK